MNIQTTETAKQTAPPPLNPALWPDKDFHIEIRYTPETGKRTVSTASQFHKNHLADFYTLDDAIDFAKESISHPTLPDQTEILVYNVQGQPNVRYFYDERGHLMRHSLKFGAPTSLPAPARTDIIPDTSKPATPTAPKDLSPLVSIDIFYDTKSGFWTAIAFREKIKDGSLEITLTARTRAEAIKHAGLSLPHLPVNVFDKQGRFINEIPSTSPTKKPDPTPAPLAAFVDISTKPLLEARMKAVIAKAKERTAAEVRAVAAPASPVADKPYVLASPTEKPKRTKKQGADLLNEIACTLEADADREVTARARKPRALWRPDVARETSITREMTLRTAAKMIRGVEVDPAPEMEVVAVADANELAWSGTSIADLAHNYNGATVEIAHLGIVRTSFAAVIQDGPLSGRLIEADSQAALDRKRWVGGII